MIFCFFGHSGAIWGSLKGPLGVTIIYFLKFYILLLNTVQTRPTPRFCINPLRKYKKKKVSIHKFGLFSVVPRTPPKGGSLYGLLGVEIWEKGLKLFFISKYT